jgi:transposase-like protein
MKKTKIIEGCRCPKCGKTENQAKKGFNKSGTQKMFCKECGAYYTLDPKRHEYSEELKLQALKIYYSGVSGRGVGKILGMSKANVYNWIKKNGSNKRG